MKLNYRMQLYFVIIGVLLGSFVSEGYAQDRNFLGARDRIERLLHRARPSSRTKNLPWVSASKPFASAFRKSAAVEKDRFVVDTALTKGAKDTLHYSFAFDAQGRKLLALGKKLNSGRWTDTLRSDTRYYEHGGEVNVNEVMIQGQWTRKTWDSSAFDASGRWQLHEDEQYVDGFVTGGNRRLACIDSCGRYASIVCGSLIGDAWVDYVRYTYKYSTDGIVDTCYGDWMDGSGAHSRAIVTRDPRGNPVTTSEQFLENGEWTPYTFTQNSFDELGNPDRSLLQMFTDSGWTNLDREKWSFSPKGVFLGFHLDEWRDSIWVAICRDTCLYDDDQRLVFEEFESSWNGEMGQDRQCQTYSYDVEGRIFQVRNFRWMNSTWQPDTTEGSGATIVDSLGNWYSFSSCYDLQLSYRTLMTDAGVPKTGEPARFLLSQNYPNPLNPTTVISGQWTVDSEVRLAVYDVLGREAAVLASGRSPAGKYEFPFDGRNLSSGVYYYRLQAENATATKAMLLIK